MTLLIRLIATLLGAAFWRPRLMPFDTGVLRQRVWITDIDVNLHLNNSRYLAIMDLGRLDYLFRAGLLLPIIRRGWKPVVGGCMIRYRRQLKPLQRFTQETRLIAWDTHWFHFLHRLRMADGTVAAVALSKATLIDGQGKVATQRVADAVGHALPPAPWVEAVEAWLASEAALDEGDTVCTEQPAMPQRHADRRDAA